MKAATRGVPQEMLNAGNWLTPSLASVPYFEKPPLFYWLVASAYSLFGQSEGAARAVPALAAFLTVWMTFSFGRHHFGQRAGLLAAGILATAPLFFIFSSIARDRYGPHGLFHGDNVRVLPSM